MQQKAAHHEQENLDDMLRCPLTLTVLESQQRTFAMQQGAGIDRTWLHKPACYYCTQQGPKRNFVAMNCVGREGQGFMTKISGGTAGRGGSEGDRWTK